MKSTAKFSRLPRVLLRLVETLGHSCNEIIVLDQVGKFRLLVRFFHELAKGIIDIHSRQTCERSNLLCETETWLTITGS